MSPARAPGGLATLLLSLLALNLVLTLANLWPTPWVRPTAALSLDLAGLVLLAALLAEVRGGPGRWLAVLLPILLLAMVLGHYAQITLAGLFGRPVDLASDLRHLPSLTRMATRVTPAWLLALAALALPLALAALWFLLRALTRPLLDALGQSRTRRALALGAALLLLAGLALPADWRAPSLAAGAWHQIAKDRSPAKGGLAVDLSALRGRDLYIVFWESYGATLLDDPAKRAALAPTLAAFEAPGWHVASTLVEAPTFGGGSWLSHGSLLTGRMLRDEGRYRQVLTAPGETLLHQAVTAGYRTVALMPGLKSHWPEGKTLGFQEILDAEALDYQGPAFGWWAIPDQASLETLYRTEIVPTGRPPLLVVFPSVMSHIPFAPTPPYQPDWSRMAGSTPYDPSALAEALADLPEWQNLGPAYLRAVKHNFTWLEGFLRQRAPGDGIVLVLGDHQPPALISGPDARWAVPVHVFSKDPGLIERLTAAGLAPGLIPPTETSGDMSGLISRLFTGLSND
ncbi:MAG: hypothetical protein AAF495_13010 [Pseudomonadota bacterium]